jgi:hypothetical protein
MDQLIPLKERHPVLTLLTKVLQRATASRLDLVSYLIIFTLFLAALGLGHLHQVGFFGVETDFYGGYTSYARGLLEGKGYIGTFHPPGYTLLLSGLYLLVKDLFLAGKIINIFSYLLFGLITYQIFRSIFNQQVGLVTTLITMIALLPASYLAAMDILGALLFSLPLWLVLTVNKIGWKRLFIAGALAGLAYLVRTNNIAVLAGLLLGLVMLLPQASKISKRLVYAGVFTAGALLVVTPWLMYGYSKTGHFLPSDHYQQIGSTLCLGESGVMITELEPASYQFSSMRDVLACNPAGFVYRYLKNILVTHPNNLFTGGVYLPAYLLVGAGFIYVLRRATPQKISLLIAYLPAYLLLGLVGFQLRYFYLLYPLLFGLAAVFLFESGVLPNIRIPFSNRLFPASWIAVFLIAGVTSAFAVERIYGDLRSEPRYILEAAAYLESVAEPGETVLVRKPHLTYYAGLTRFFPMANSPEEFLEAATEQGIRFIVYSDFEAGLWQGLRTLRDPLTLPPQFHLVYEDPANHLLIYSIPP